ncbi:MAG: bifunctional protein PyrR [Fimbriimonadales bacterium]|nr:MAG: bifunctional protein PyrR [Fimbriimonadales bacterium]
MGKSAAVIMRPMAERRIDASDIRRTLGRMAHEILESNQGAEDLVVVGILARGYPVARRLAFAMTQIEGVTIPCGSLDVRPYRDDLEGKVEDDKSEIPFAVTGKKVILVDEVIMTGRSVRAALDALMHHGRPASVRLAVLVDRGGRELPIQPDYVGLKLEVPDEEWVDVRLSESAGEDSIVIVKREGTCIS